MGRIFETRKATMFARWDKMSKAFTRIGKEIVIAVKKGGPLLENNPSLRRVLQNAHAVNMPKDKVEAAIKRASGVGKIIKWHNNSLPTVLWCQRSCSST